MFSNFIRLGAALSAAVLLASCSSGSGQAETQQSTPEGLFEGQITTTFTNSPAGTGTTSTTLPSCGGPQNVILFVDYAGAFYMFNTASAPAASNQQPQVLYASSGTMTFSGGSVGSSSVLEVVPPNSIGVSATAPNGTNCGVPITYAGEKINGVTQVGNSANAPTFTGAYNTAQNIAGVFTYPLAIDNNNDFKTSCFGTGGCTSATNSLTYDTDYQNVQNLGTLAGTYTGTVATSQFSESATFTFGPASVAANSGNAFGVGLVSGTGASGCTYNGTVSPLFKGNGYTLLLNSGGIPCALPNNQFAGLVYLYAAGNQLYSFSPNAARTDGLIFTGLRQH
jgi:hypothetical protein